MKVRILCRKQHAFETESILEFYELDFCMPVRYCEMDCGNCKNQYDQVIQDLENTIYLVK